MAKKELPEDEGPSQAWLASYADAMTLLLAFFIMMFAFALIDEGKYFDFKVGVMAALGVPDPLTDNTDSILSQGTGFMPELGFTPVPPTEEDAEAAEETREELAEAGMVTPENAEDLKELLTQEFASVGAADWVDVGIDERGVFIRFDGQVLFESGQASLDNNGLTLLTTAADVLGVIDNRLEVEGHTDSQPTGGEWPSNWELSSARSSRVVRWLIESRIPAPRLIAIGMADTRPRGDNATPEGRQLNRRVEIVIRVDGIVDSDVAVIDTGISNPVELDPIGGSGPASTGDLDPIVAPTVNPADELVRQ
ncbi:MAG: flagellar motor protein MotB [Actinomycetia bacterium]|nr:flagellar motor protein MotB [Actinomycetes bacterium]